MPAAVTSESRALAFTIHLLHDAVLHATAARCRLHFYSAARNCYPILSITHYYLCFFEIFNFFAILYVNIIIFTYYTICIISIHLLNYSIQYLSDVPLANKNRIIPICKQLQLRMPLLTTSLQNIVQYVQYIGKDKCNILFTFKVTVCVTCKFLSLDVYY